MDLLKMYSLLNMGIFQPAMLVYQRVPESVKPGAMRSLSGGTNLTSNKPTIGAQFKIWCGIEDESSI